MASFEILPLGLETEGKTPVPPDINSRFLFS